VTNLFKTLHCTKFGLLFFCDTVYNVYFIIWNNNETIVRAPPLLYLFSPLQFKSYPQMCLKEGCKFSSFKRTKTRSVTSERV